MQKFLFSLILLIFLSLKTFGQENSNYKWSISFDFAIQKHDKRLFNASDKNYLLSLHPENFGTHQFGIRAERKIFSKNKFKFNTGIGISTEINNFTRPFNLRFKRDPNQLLILPFSPKHQKGLVLFPIITQYNLNRFFSFSIELLSQFSFITLVEHGIGGGTLENPLGWRRLDFHSVEFNPSINFHLNRIEFLVKMRAFQLKKIDRIFFYKA